MGIEQAEADDVETFVCVLLEIGPRIVDHPRRAWIVVWPLGMQFLPDLHDERIDIHGDDSLESAAQCGRDIIAGTRADHERALAFVSQRKWQPVGLIEVAEHSTFARSQARSVQAAGRKILHVLMKVAIYG